MQEILTPGLLNLASNAGATVIVICLLYFALRVYRMQHERTMLRDKMFLEALSKQHEALIDCVRQRIRPD